MRQLEKQFGFDKPAWQRFVHMMRSYLVFDLGTSFYRDRPVLGLMLEKLPVSITLGLWTTLLVYLISIPLGVAKAVRDGTPFDVWTSAAVIVGYAIPGFLFAILLVVLLAGGSFVQWFPLRGLTSDTWALMSWPQRIVDYLWHIALPVTALVVGGFAALTMLTKNSFLDEINKQYVVTARAKGLSWRRVLYGHVFRNAMLIVVAGFPSAFVAIFFAGELLIEVIFSLDGLGLLGFEAAVNRDYPVMFGTLYLYTLIGLLAEHRDRPDLHGHRSADRLRAARHVSLSPLMRRRLASFRASRRGYWSLWLFLTLFVLSLGADLLANDRPLLVRYDGRFYVPVLRGYPETAFGGELPTEAVYRDPGRATAHRGAWLDRVAADPVSLRHDRLGPAGAAPRRRPRAATGSAPTTRAAICWRG